MTAGFLASLPPDGRALLESAGRPRRSRRGEVLLREGDAGDSVVVLLAGWAKVVAASTGGHEAVLAVRGPGDIVGELSAIDPGGARSATVIAMEPVECRVMTGEEFRQVIAASGETALALLRLIVRRLRDADRRRIEFGAFNTAQRLSRVLLELATEHGVVAADGVELALALSQDELAGLSAASRESVARALGSLRSAGLVSTARRRLVVHDLAALERYASQ